MANNSDKLWLQKRLNEGAIQRAREAIHQIGRALPCTVTSVSGAMVTVKFEVDSSPWTLPQITIPKAESNWVRMPTQVGDKGITVPADTYIGNISGTSSTIPKIDVRPANMAALVFMPVSNSHSPPPDQNAATVQGPNGAIIQTTTGTASSITTDTSGTVVTYGSNTVTLNGSQASMIFGASSVVVTDAGITLSSNGSTIEINSGGVTINGIAFGSHVHSGVQPGTGTSGGPE